MSHVLEHVPASRRYAECCEISEINTLLRATTKDVHGVVDQSSRVAFACYWNVPNAVQLSPAVGARIIGPNIVEPGNTVGATKEIESVLPRYYRVIGASWRRAGLGRDLVLCIRQEYFPAAG